MKIRPYGDTALLVQPRERTDLLALAAALRADPGVAEVVPAARTVLVRARLPRDLPQLTRRVREAAAQLNADPNATSHDASAGAEVMLDVHYDGADLAATAAEVGLDPDGLVRVHTAARYVVAFCGFAPGFAYLSGLPRRLHVPRLPRPRTNVAAGSVAIAGEFTGVYPRPSPGGWRLLGRTDAPLWDLARTPPALLSPGTRVRFRSA